mmetsp:Transcript_36038/g.56250  ORF Transcript_36038/g.56250 Transcript_36038/m.56250 type:complete len:109 (-) Transcript_36038:11-337(-)
MRFWRFLKVLVSILSKLGRFRDQKFQEWRENAANVSFSPSQSRCFGRFLNFWSDRGKIGNQKFQECRETTVNVSFSQVCHAVLGDFSIFGLNFEYLLPSLKPEVSSMW